MPKTPTAIPRTAAERVYQRFYEDLRSQALQPGQHIIEEELARRYEVSRTPVREALRRLIQDGLVERSGGGLRVSRLTPRQVDEIYPIVAVLEGLAARLAAERLTPATRRRLRDLHERMAAAAAAGDQPAFLKNNQRFHSLILAAAGNDQLTREIERFRLITLHLRHQLLRLPGRMSSSAVEHDDLLAALEAGDADASEQTMRGHVEAAHEVLAVALAAAGLVAGEAVALRRPRAARAKDAQTKPTTPAA